MTNPASPIKASYYDPNPEMCRADEGASSRPLDAPSASGGPSPARELTIPPVSIMGDAGAQQLVEQYERARYVPDCTADAASAALSCAKSVVAAVSTGLASPSVAGTALGVVKTILEGVSCGKELRAYYECRNQ